MPKILLRAVAMKCHRRLDTIRCWAVGLLFLLSVEVIAAEPGRVLPDDKRPADQRLQPLKDLNGYFPFVVPQDAQQWQTRAEQIRRRMLVSQGLWPMPRKTELNAQIYDRREMPGQGDVPGYSVEKVTFECLPGFVVTGNLFRPLSDGGNRPGVLCPHGHWSQGRFYDAGEEAVKKSIADGAEKFIENGRNPIQARSAHLARMGCVVLQYDMIGYADSQQISFELAHRFAEQREHMNSETEWGFFSPQAESHLQSIMGLQTLSSIRALDFLTSLPDVDPSRLAVTGASGGGTQTFMVCAVDPRPAFAFPAVMVSTAMQGGCTCENASLLRVGTGNVEFAGLFAPKPMGLTAADDWTKEMATKGFPELQALYRMLGAPDNVSLTALTHFGHNYNHVSRAAMYQLVNRHFKLGLPEPVEEQPIERLLPEDITVWDEHHPKPEGGERFERRLLQAWHADTQQQLAAVVPRDRPSLAQFQQLIGGGLDIVIGRGLPDAGAQEFELVSKTDRGDYREMGGWLRHRTAGEELPIVFLHPETWNGQVVIWVDPQGKQGLWQAEPAETKLIPAVQQLLAAGTSVVGVDLLFQGEFLADQESIDETRVVNNPREAAAYTFGYNPSLFAQRTHDILSVITFVRNHDKAPRQVHLVGLKEAGPWVAAARAQAREAIDRAVVDTQGFRFLQVDSLRDPRFLPGGAKYFDLPGMLAVAAPGRVWLAGENEVPDVMAAAYQAAGARDHVQAYSGAPEQAAEAATRWLLQTD